MKKVFVDTSGWANLADLSEPFHSDARNIYLQSVNAEIKFITTNYILTELVAVLTSPLRLPRSMVIEFTRGIMSNPSFEIIHIDPSLDIRSWELLANRPDKNWSLVDCSCFVVMDDLNIQEALTSDHHFEQAGLIRLLK